MNRFEGKVAIVAGGSSGIGYEIVKLLIAEGAKVVVGARRKELLDQMEQDFGKNLVGVSSDVTVGEDHAKLVQTAVERFGRLDTAFNVAGGSKVGTIGDISEEDWMWTIDLCLKGVFLGMKHQINQMKQTGGGSIVNISSLNGEVPMWGGSAYASAKAGTDMLTKNAVLEYTKNHIRFNAVLPGLTDTPLTKGLTGVEAIHEAYMDRIPMKRTGKPEEIAKAALFLASDDASYITGATLIVDGGWSTTGYPDLSVFLGK